MQRKINLRAVAILLALGAILSTGAYFVRGWQIRRNAGAFLARADAAKEAKDTAKELGYLQFYLGQAPHDHEARARLALLFAEHAKTHGLRERAYYFLEAALRVLPDREDLRRQAIRTAGELRRHADAIHHLKVLDEAAGGKDPDIVEALAKNEAARRNWQEAEKRYEQTIGLAPKRTGAYVALARLLRHELNRPRPADADKVIERMAKANPEDRQTQVARAAYLRETDLSAADRERLRQTIGRLALQHAKTLPQALLVAASLEQEAGDTAAARAFLTQGRKLHPKVSAFAQELARLELKAGHKKEALEALRSLSGDRGLDSDYLTTVELMLETGEIDEARKLIERVGRTEEGSPVRDYLEARLAVSEERWLEAMRLLERARKATWLPAEFLQSIALSLSRAHRELGNHDRELEAADAALTFNQGWLPARLARADALVALGLADDALPLYEAVQGRVPDARFAAVALRAARMMRRPELERDWAPIRRQLDETPAGVRQTPRFAQTAARLDVAQGKRDEARKLLEEAVVRHPGEATLWLLLAAVADDGKDAAQALAVLARAEKALGDRVEVRLARARLSERGGDKKAADAALAAAEKEAEKRKGKEQAAWLRAVAAARQGRGDRADAVRLYTRLTELRPDDLPAWRELFDLATGRNDREELDRVVRTLERLEGDLGVTWRLGRALLLATTGDKAGRARATEWLNEAQKHRPGWGKTYLLGARIAEADGDRSRAVEQYQRALRTGEATPEVVARLVGLLSARRDDAEVQAVLARYREMIPHSTELSGASAVAALRGPGTPEKAAENALASLPEASPDPRIQIMRGQVLWAGKKLPEAEKALRLAVKLGPKLPEAHLALVGFLKEGAKKPADAEIEAARAALPPETALLTVAACRDIVGPREKAEEAYKAALAARPDDIATLRAVAGYHLRRGQTAQAEKLLEDVIRRAGADSAVAASARRTLALASAGGGYEQYKKALDLIKENARRGPETPEDKRARALIHAQQPRDRRKAVRELEDSFLGVRPSAGESFFLATLYVGNGEWPKAKEILVRLLSSSSREAQNPMYLAYFLEQMARHEAKLPDRLEREAAPWLERLEKEDAGSLRTAGIKARLLKAYKRDADARAVLSRYAGAHAKDGARLMGAARLTEALGYPDDAEPHYRGAARLLAEKGAGPQFTLAQFLGRRGKTAEALELCAKLRGKVPDVNIGEAAVNILREGKPTPEQTRLVISWMQEAKKKHPKEDFFDLVLANIDDLTGDSAAAIAAYRAVLSRDPGNLLAINNLAVLLAFKGQADEALASINKAIDLAGPQPDLLDTKGIVLTAKGDYRKAVETLEEAVQMAPDPATQARLAVALFRADEPRQAGEALKAAKAAGFQPSGLHPLERPAYEAAEKVLGGDGS